MKYLKNASGDWRIGRIVAIVSAVFALSVLLLLGGCSATKEYSRYQKRADAKNAVTVKNIEIKKAKQQAQITRAQVEATKAEADKRREEAKGIRDAQKTIDTSLTASYLQYEAIKKLPAGRAIYIPSGGMGIPQVQDVGTPIKPEGE